MMNKNISKLFIFIISIVYIAILCSTSFAVSKDYNYACILGDTCTAGTCIDDTGNICDTTNTKFCGCCNLGEKWDSSVGKCVVVEWTVTKGDENTFAINSSQIYYDDLVCSMNDTVNYCITLYDCYEGEICAESNGIGICCDEGFSNVNNVCVDQRIKEDQKGCNNDKDCQAGLHCSNEHTCCSQGEEFDKKENKCIACGVESFLGSNSFCSDKLKIGCACKENEGTCTGDEQCFGDSYCSNKICCQKGKTNKNGMCVESQLFGCNFNNKEDCFASKDNCNFVGGLFSGKCSKKSKLLRNEGICNSNSMCDTNLKCVDEYGFDEVEFGICCHEWEQKSEQNGKCELINKDADSDSDGSNDFIESELYSNPMNSKDTPFPKIMDYICVNYYETPDGLRMLLSLAYINPVLLASRQVEIMTHENWGDYNLLVPVEEGAMLFGAANGLWDDVSGVGELFWMLGKEAAKLAGFKQKIKEDEEKNKTSFWDSVGQVLRELFRLHPEDALSPFLNINSKTLDCQHVALNKGYLRGYYTGYALEQFGTMAFGYGEIKAAMKGGFEATKIGKALKKLNEIYSALNLDLEFYGEILTKVKMDKWGKKAQIGFAKIAKDIGRDEVDKLVTKYGANGAEKLSNLADDYGVGFVVKLDKISSSDYIIRNLESADLDKLAKATKDLPEKEFNEFFNSMNKKETKSFLDNIKKGGTITIKIAKKLPDDDFFRLMGMKRLFGKYVDDVDEIAKKIPFKTKKEQDAVMTAMGKAEHFLGLTDKDVKSVEFMKLEEGTLGATNNGEIVLSTLVSSKSLAENVINHEYSHIYVTKKLGGKATWNFLSNPTMGRGYVEEYEEFLVEITAKENIPGHKLTDLTEISDIDDIHTIYIACIPFDAPIPEAFSKIIAEAKIYDPDKYELIQKYLKTIEPAKADKLNEVADLFIRNKDILQSSTDEIKSVVKDCETNIKELRELW